MSWAAFYALLRRELRALAQERTVLIAFFIQLFIASFSSALLAGLVSVYDPDAERLASQIRPRVGVVESIGTGDAGEEEMNIVDLLAEALEQAHARVVILGSTEAAQRAFENGQLDAAILVPASSTTGVSEEPMQIELVLPDSPTYATVLRMALRKPLADFENLLRRSNGIELRYQDIDGETSTAFEFRYGALVPLLMFFPAFVTGGIVVDTVSEEMADRTLETLWSTPLSLSAIIGAKVTAGLLTSIVQSVAWWGLLRLNGVSIRNSGVVLLLAALGATIVGLVSAAFALIFQDRERSQFVYALFILLVTSLSYFSNVSPIALVSRFAVGDPTVGILHVAIYIGVMIVVALTLRSASRRLVAG